MPSTSPCTPCCTTPQSVDVPGPAGTSAFTTTSASFIVPAADANVTIAVTDTSWMSASMNLWIPTGNYKIVSVNTPTSVTVKFLSFDGDVAAGTTVVSGTLVVAGTGNVDFPLSFANGGTSAATRLAAVTALINNQMAGVNALTDNSTGTAGDTIAAGVGDHIICVYVQLAQITATTIWNITPGYRFKVLAINFTVEVAATTAAKAATITPSVGGVAVTGGALALTSANCTPKGTTVAGSAITAGNTGTSAQTLTLVASLVTAFSEGTGWIILRVQNMDSADAVASIASKVNSLRTSLTN